MRTKKPHQAGDPAITMAALSGPDATCSLPSQQRQVGAQQAEAEQQRGQQQGECEHTVLITTLLHRVRTDSDRDQHQQLRRR